jgi:hypothetical protein
MMGTKGTGIANERKSKMKTRLKALGWDAA